MRRAIPAAADRWRLHIPAKRLVSEHDWTVHAGDDSFIRAQGHFVGEDIRKDGSTIHRGHVVSNALAETTEARSLAKILVDQEHRRVGDRIVARQRVARSLGVSPGTIENIQRSRLKRISGWLRDAMRARVIRELEAEIVKLQHELAVLRQIGADPRGDEMAAVRADLSAVLEVLGRDRRP